MFIGKENNLIGEKIGMNKKRVIIFLFIIFLLSIVVIFTNPLRKSQTKLHEWIVLKTPINTSIVEVRNLIVQNKWEAIYEWKGSPSVSSRNKFPGVKGSHIIGAYLGHYQGLPWRVDVDAYWGFNSEGKLIDLRVRKMADSI